MEEKCEARREWCFIKVKEKSHLRGRKRQGEAASADVEAVASYSDPAKVVNKGGYTEQQTFNQNETA